MRAHGISWAGPSLKAFGKLSGELIEKWFKLKFHILDNKYYNQIKDIIKFTSSIIYQ